MTNRAKPGNMVLHHPVTFGQLHSYNSPDPIEETMAPGYFTAVKDGLNPGDEIRICYVVSGRVRERQDVLVVAVSNTGVELYPIGKRIVVPEPKAEKPGPSSVLPGARLEVRKGYQCYQLIFADTGKAIQEYGTKAEAEAAMAEIAGRTEKAA